MLDPDSRNLYVEAVRPPIGYQLDQAIATTYSLDLNTLLTVPLTLALPHLDARSLSKYSTITILDAIKRIVGRVTVYANQGQIAAPAGQHLLYGLLEPVIVETRAPQGGALHAKFWVMRFVSDDSDQPVMMRLFVTSRNLTADRSWDVALQLDGHLRGRNQAVNRPLADLVLKLPELALRAVPDAARGQAVRLSEEIRRVEWEKPPGFDEISFHVLGLSRKQWVPPQSQRLLVVSPFVRAKALRALAETTQEPVALISRAEELDALDPAALKLFLATHVLHQAAETEDGEEQTRGRSPSGLHAKLYIAKQGWTTSMYLGSANASDAALIGANNIELLVGLTGKTSKVGGIDSFLDPDGFGSLLVDYVPTSAASETDPDEAADEEALNGMKRALLDAELSIHFETIKSSTQATLVGTVEVPSGISAARAWLVTSDPSSAAPIDGLWNGGKVLLGVFAASSATGLIAFELEAARRGLKLSFTLNLPAIGIPADRDAQVLRVIVDNRDRFLQYLRALLDGIDGEPLPPPEYENGGLLNGSSGSWARPVTGLLEQLIRTKAHAPERLVDIRRLVDALCQTPEGDALIPDEFKAVWAAVDGDAP